MDGARPALGAGFQITSSSLLCLYMNSWWLHFCAKPAIQLECCVPIPVLSTCLMLLITTQQNSALLCCQHSPRFCLMAVALSRLQPTVSSSIFWLNFLHWLLSK